MVLALSVILGAHAAQGPFRCRQERCLIHLYGLVLFRDGGVRGAISSILVPFY